MDQQLSALSITQVKTAVMSRMAQLAKLYIRYSPVSLFKPFLWARVGWRYRQFLARTRFGALMAGYSQDTVQGYIYYFGIWEPNLSAFINRRLAGQAGRTFVDVGANVGYFSLLAAKKMPAGTVVAIEAFPSIYMKLQANINLNGFCNIRTVPYAATQTSCQIEMFHGGPTNEGATTTVSGRFNVDPITVEGRPISELLTEIEIRSMRLMKIDVEGAEYSVIQGMRSILNSLQSDAEIVMEISPAALGDDKTSEIFEILSSAGYFPYILENFYAASEYIFSNPITRPTRLRSLPKVQTDVVFSKVDVAYL